MRSQLIRVLPRTDYDFSALAAGTGVTNLPLVQDIDLTQWGGGTVIVRVHAVSLKSGSYFQIDARSVAPTDEDPALFFRDGSVVTIRAASASASPYLLHGRIADNAGSAMSLFLSVSQAIAGVCSFTISIDVLLQEPAVGWTPALLGSKLKLWLDQRDQIAVSQAYSDWGDQSPSGTQDFTQGTAANRPAAGSDINGFSAPSFDGVNDSMTGGSLSSFVNATAYHVFAVFRARTISGTSGTTYLNNAVVADTGIGWWGLYLKNNGGAYEAHGFHWDSSLKEAVVPVMPNENCLIEWSYDGSMIRCRTYDPSQTASTSGVGSIGNVTNAVSLGFGATGAVYLDGVIASIIVCDAYLSDTEVNNVRSYLSSRYGVPA